MSVLQYWKVYFLDCDREEIEIAHTYFYAPQWECTSEVGNQTVTERGIDLPRERDILGEVNVILGKYRFDDTIPLKSGDIEISPEDYGFKVSFKEIQTILPKNGFLTKINCLIFRLTK